MSRRCVFLLVCFFVGLIDADPDPSRLPLIDADTDLSQHRRIDADPDPSRLLSTDADTDLPRRRRIDADPDPSRLLSTDADTDLPRRRRNDADPERPPTLPNDADTESVLTAPLDADPAYTFACGVPACRCWLDETRIIMELIADCRGTGTETLPFFNGKELHRLVKVILIGTPFCRRFGHRNVKKIVCAGYPRTTPFASPTHTKDLTGNLSTTSRQSLPPRQDPTPPSDTLRSAAVSTAALTVMEEVVIGVFSTLLLIVIGLITTCLIKVRYFLLLLFFSEMFINVFFQKK